MIENEGIWMNGKRKLCPPTSTREKTPIYVHRSVMATGADHLRIYGRSTYQKPQPCCTPPVGPARCVIPWLRRQYEERMARQSLSLSLCRDHVVVCPAPYEYNKFLRICYCTTPRKGQRDISAMTGVEEGLRWCIWFQDLPLI